MKALVVTVSLFLSVIVVQAQYVWPQSQHDAANSAFYSSGLGMPYQPIVTTPVSLPTTATQTSAVTGGPPYVYTFSTSVSGATVNVVSQISGNILDTLNITCTSPGFDMAVSSGGMYISIFYTCGNTLYQFNSVTGDSTIRYTCLIDGCLLSTLRISPSGNTAIILMHNGVAYIPLNHPGIQQQVYTVTNGTDLMFAYMKPVGGTEATYLATELAISAYIFSSLNPIWTTPLDTIAPNTRLTGLSLDYAGNAYLSLSGVQGVAKVLMVQPGGNVNWTLSFDAGWQISPLAVDLNFVHFVVNGALWIATHYGTDGASIPLGTGMIVNTAGPVVDEAGLVYVVQQDTLGVTNILYGVQTEPGLANIGIQWQLNIPQSGPTSMLIPIGLGLLAMTNPNQVTIYDQMSSTIAFYDTSLPNAVNNTINLGGGWITFFPGEIPPLVGVQGYQGGECQWHSIGGADPLTTTITHNFATNRLQCLAPANDQGISAILTVVINYNSYTISGSAQALYVRAPSHVGPFIGAFFIFFVGMVMAAIGIRLFAPGVNGRKEWTRSEDEPLPRVAAPARASTSSNYGSI